MAAGRCGSSLPLRLQLRHTQWGEGYTCRLPLLVKVINEAAIVGFFPNGQPWTGSAPGFENVGVRARMWADPLKEVQNQWLYGVRHSYLVPAASSQHDGGLSYARQQCHAGRV